MPLRGGGLRPSRGWFPRGAGPRPRPTAGTCPRDSGSQTHPGQEGWRRRLCPAVPSDSGGRLKGTRRAVPGRAAGARPDGARPRRLGRGSPHRAGESGGAAPRRAPLLAPSRSPHVGGPAGRGRAPLASLARRRSSKGINAWRRMTRGCAGTLKSHLSP